MTDGPARRDFDALSFDVLGTVLNWEPEIARFLGDWLRPAGVEKPDNELLELYDRLRQPIQNQRPAHRYPVVLRDTLLAMGTELGVTTDSEHLERFAGIAATHSPFGDSVEALNRFRAMGLKLAALSNIDDQSFAIATGNAGLQFDVVVTAQRVGAYKPDHAHFWAALSDLQALGVPKNRVLHVAQSRRADITVANAIGLCSVWVNRPGHIFGRSGSGAETAMPDWEVDSLSRLAELLSLG